MDGIADPKENIAILGAHLRHIALPIQDQLDTGRGASAAAANAEGTALAPVAEHRQTDFAAQQVDVVLDAQPAAEDSGSS